MTFDKEVYKNRQWRRRYFTHSKEEAQNFAFKFTGIYWEYLPDTWRVII